MRKILKQFADLWGQLGLNQKISLVLATAVVVALMAGMIIWSSRPDMQLLYGRLDSKDAGQIVSYLENQNIKYKIGGGGTAIYVPRDQVYKARMELASKGMPSGGSVGFEIFDRGNFGISDFVQRTNYLRAIQGELSRTIAQLDGVRAARVMVVMPQNRLLVSDTTVHPTASVLVDTGGATLGREAVSSIRSLVANAVEGLKPKDVVVADNQGDVLSDQLNDDSLSGLTSGQIRYRKSIEDYFSHKVESMLSAVLGSGKVVARVSAQIDTTTTTTNAETYDPDSQVARSETVSSDTNVSQQIHPQGAAGTGPNVPASGSSQGSGSQGSSQTPTTSTQQTRKTKTDNYEISRTTTNEVKNPGSISRLTAAVFVAMRTTGTGANRKPEPRTPEELNSLRQMVVNALGIVPAKGESLDKYVTLQEVNFAPNPLVEKQGVMEKQKDWSLYYEIGRTGLAILLAIGIFFYFIRQLHKHRPTGSSLEIISQQEASEFQKALEPGGAVTPEVLNDLVRQKPANVGLTLKEWMAASAKK